MGEYTHECQKCKGRIMWGMPKITEAMYKAKGMTWIQGIRQEIRERGHMEDISAKE